MNENFELEIIKLYNKSKYSNFIARKYCVSEEALSRLLIDFDLVYRHSMGPNQDEPVPMSMTEIAKAVGLPIKVVGRLQDEKAIGRPILESDLDFLRSYQRVWGNWFFIRSQLSSLSQSQRTELLKRPELSSKWERWAYATILKSKIEYRDDGTVANPHDRIRIHDLADEIESIFGIPKTENLLNRLKKIRETAYNDKRKAKCGQEDLSKIAEGRDINLKEFE